MDGLEALVSPVGPAMTGFNAGQETARKYEEQQNQQGLRQAQMQEIMQNIEQRKQTNPLDVQSKQIKLQTDKLDAAIKQNDTYLDFLGKAGTVLEAVPALPGQRHAVLNQMLAGSGIDRNNPEVQQVMKQLEQVPPDQLPKTLGTLRDRLVQTSSAYQQKKMEMDAHIKQTQITADASRYATDQRAQLAKDRAADAASDEKMLAKLGNNYAGQQTYYEKKAHEAYLAGNDSNYNYYTALRDKAAQMDKDVRAAPTDAKTAAELARLKSLQGVDSVIVKPPASLSIQDKRNAL